MSWTGGIHRPAAQVITGRVVAMAHQPRHSAASRPPVVRPSDSAGSCKIGHGVWRDQVPTGVARAPRAKAG